MAKNAFIGQRKIGHRTPIVQALPATLTAGAAENTAPASSAENGPTAQQEDGDADTGFGTAQEGNAGTTANRWELPPLRTDQLTEPTAGLGTAGRPEDLGDGGGKRQRRSNPVPLSEPNAWLLDETRLFSAGKRKRFIADVHRLCCLACPERAPEPSEIAATPAELDNAAHDDGLEGLPFKAVSIVVLGQAPMTLHVRDVLAASERLHGCPCCGGDDFCDTASDRPNDGVLRVHADGANFRDAELLVSAKMPGARLGATQFWSDGAVHDSRKMRKTHMVAIQSGNVSPPRQRLPGHQITVAYLPVVKSDDFVRRDGTPCSSEERTIISAAIVDACWDVILRPLRDRNEDRFGNTITIDPTSPDFPGWPARGGHISKQRLPGLQDRHAPVIHGVTQMKVDGTELCQMVHSKQNWGAIDSCPPHHLGNPHPDTVRREVSTERWLSDTKKGWDVFEPTFKNGGVMADWKKIMEETGRVPGVPGELPHVPYSRLLVTQRLAQRGDFVMFIRVQFPNIACPRARRNLHPRLVEPAETDDDGRAASCLARGARKVAGHHGQRALVDEQRNAEPRAEATLCPLDRLSEPCFDHQTGPAHIEGSPVPSNTGRRAPHTCGAARPSPGVLEARAGRGAVGRMRAG